VRTLFTLLVVLLALALVSFVVVGLLHRLAPISTR